jgi:hypothetical protein
MPFRQPLYLNSLLHLAWTDECGFHVSFTLCVLTTYEKDPCRPWRLWGAVTNTRSTTSEKWGCRSRVHSKVDPLLFYEYTWSVYICCSRMRKIISFNTLECLSSAAKLMISYLKLLHFRPFNKAGLRKNRGQKGATGLVQKRTSLWRTLLVRQCVIMR